MTKSRRLKAAAERKFVQVHIGTPAARSYVVKNNLVRATIKACRLAHNFLP
ncbi:MAG: hypothetical protein Q7S09_05180 [bacterium]|nr:hypothetical protein [bacterium]